MYAEIFFIIIFIIPLYAFLLWMYHEPEASILSGHEWVFKKRPQVSEKAIRYTKFVALITMIYVPFFVLLIFFQHILLVLMLVAYCLVIIIGVMKILGSVR